MKKPSSRNQCGTALAGPNMLLHPEIPTTQLYMSRLHHYTKVEEIMEYLRVKTSWILRVEMLESRHNTNFKSVRVPTQHLEIFLKEEFWPKSVVYRRFRRRLRDTTQRYTTPSLRVKQFYFNNYTFYVLVYKYCYLCVFNFLWTQMPEINKYYLSLGICKGILQGNIFCYKITLFPYSSEDILSAFFNIKKSKKKH